MGLPLSHGKLAIWLFLVTEIMFFTGLIGTYLILRNGQPNAREPWPKPHDVHLVEWIGALNTFVLICSSVSVVIAHWALEKANVKLAVQMIGITLALGTVFLVVKAYEYRSKFQHDILPGHIGERLEAGPTGQQYVKRVRKQLDHIKANPAQVGLTESSAAYKESMELLDKMSDREEEVNGVKQVTPGLTPVAVGEAVNHLMHEHEDVHLSPAIPYGNLWASCYFAMTGFHAFHVFGGLAIFAIMLIMYARGKFGVQNTEMVEITGLYWHFVDIVWIFLFPFLYLV
jgi:cytochrome c oxidase subunit 3